MFPLFYYLVCKVTTTVPQYMIMITQVTGNGIKIEFQNLKFNILFSRIVKVFETSTTWYFNI